MSLVKRAYADLRDIVLRGAVSIENYQDELLVALWRERMLDLNSIEQFAHTAEQCTDARGCTDNSWQRKKDASCQGRA